MYHMNKKSEWEGYFQLPYIVLYKTDLALNHSSFFRIKNKSNAQALVTLVYKTNVLFIWKTEDAMKNHEYFTVVKLK